MIKLIACWIISIIFAFILFEQIQIPTIGTYGLPSPYIGKGQTEPHVVRPGDNVKVMVSEKQESIGGLFKSEKLVVIPITMVDKWKGTTFETIKDEDTWEDDAVMGAHGLNRYFFKLKDSIKTVTLNNIAFSPWIEFQSPADSSLIGTTQKFIVEFDYIYPFYLRYKEMYQRYNSTVKDTVAFNFGTATEIKNYDNWQKETSRLNRKNSLYNDIRFFSFIVFILTSICLLISFFDSGGKKI